MLLNLTENQLFNYIKCPIHYDTTYNKKFTLPEKPTMNLLLKKIWNLFCINLVNGTVLSKAVLKNKWDIVCEKNPDIITESKCLAGLGALMKMYAWAEQEELRIADINIPYNISFNRGRDSVNINGEIGAVAINAKNNLSLIDIDFNDRLTNQSMIDMKLKYTMDIYAMKALYNKDVGIRIHNIKHNKDWYSIRIPEDMERLKHTVLNVGYCINSKMFYPRESVFCLNCELLHYCKAWKV